MAVTIDPVAPEIQVSVGENPSIASLANGGVVVTWVALSTSGDGSGYNIRAQIYDANGATVGSALIVNSQLAGNQSQPVVTGLASGGFVIVWTDESKTLGDSSESSIKAQAFDASGNKVGQEFLVNTAILSRQAYPEISSLAGGGFVISWMDLSDWAANGYGGWTHKARIYNSDVQPVDNEITIQKDTANGTISSSAIGLANGGFVTTWTSFGLGDNSGTTVKARIYDANGTASTAEFRVNSITDSDQYEPSVTALKSGGFVIVWTSAGAGGRDIKAQIFDASGSKIGTEFPVCTQEAGNQVGPSVTATNTGGFIVTWMDEAGDDYVKAQMFDAAGKKIGGEFVVNNSTAAGVELYPAVAQLADGSIAIAWQDNSSGIYARFYDVNNSPTINSNGGGAIATVNLPENSTAVTTVSATDPEPNTTLTYSIYGGADAAFFRIDASNGALSFKSAPDFEAPLDSGKNNGYYVIVQVSDGALSATQAITVNITNVNEFAPVISSNGGAAAASISITENTSAVTTVAASDADAGTTLSYSISGGADAAKFQINALTGVLSFRTAPDFETATDAGANNVYDVEVQVSDGSRIDKQALAVTVTNANEAPAITSGGGGASAAISLLENTAEVTTVAATDPDAGTALTYSISGGADAAKFQINAATGVLSFRTAPDFETATDAGANNVYDVEVQISDGALTDKQTIAVTVRNANEAPAITSNGAAASAAVSIAENGTAVTTVKAIDPDAGSSLRYSISGGADSDLFQIDASTGVLRFKTAPDFEAPGDAGANNVYDVEVQASDGSLTDQQAIAVSVTNVNEAPAGGPSLTLRSSVSTPAAQFTVNDTTFAAGPGDIWSPVVAALANGGWVVVWHSLLADGLSRQTLAQVYEPDGSPAAAAFILANGSDSASPSVAALPGGGWLATWSSSEVYLRGFAADGQETIPQTQVNTYTSSVQARSSIAVLADGGWIATWTSWQQDGEREGIYAQRFAADGTRVGTEFRISTYTFDAQTDPKVAGLADGGWIAVWSSDGQDGSLEGVYGQRFAVDGTPHGGEFRVNAVTYNTQQRPAVAALEDGGWVVTWESHMQDGDGFEIYARRYDANGAEVGSEFKVNSFIQSAQVTPAITALTDGGWAITWTSNLQDGSGSGIYSRIYDAHGEPVGDEVQVNTKTAGDQWLPSIAALEDGGWVVVWRSTQPQAIYGQRYDASGQPAYTFSSYAPIGPAADLLEGTVLYADGSTIADPDGDGAVSWQWQRSNDGNAWTDISGASLASYALGKADIGHFVRLKASYVDGGGTAEIVFSAASPKVIALNAPPAITSGGGGATAVLTMFENSVEVMTVTATDPDAGTTLTYAISGGADAALFGINASTGVLSFKVAPNFEAPADAGANNVYDVEVQVSDGSLTDKQAIAITVSDIPVETITGTAADDVLVGDSGRDELFGLAGNDRLTPEAGNDQVDGGAGVDTVVIAGNRSAYTVTQTSTGVFSVTGPDGTDTLRNVEYLQFADQKIRLYPGTGTPVNFAADNPADYMAAIRDFDGNDVGAATGWKRIGAADVNGDGDIDQIFVNRANGRFAEVGTAPDGKVYFSDHGWAGETRVVGIYIDPLVQSGEVQAGGPNDSQRRFQNDLFIGNIKGVLGAGDYDRDGLQEVYFSLTDGTAFLHAYMHADGNIRYANYQSQQQVIDFLAQNGWNASTYADWFS